MSESLAHTNGHSYEITNFKDNVKLAVELKHYIKDNSLSQKISGKDYVMVEGWQFAGAMLGLAAVIRKTECLTGEDKIFKYKAVAEIINLRTGAVVGAGEAICSKAEGKKSSFDEYAIMSMAQTRAIGKAFRNLLAWVIKAAGYSPTPAEEMDFQSDVITLDIAQCRSMIAGCKNEEDLQMVYDTFPELPYIVELTKTLGKKQKELKPAA